METLASVKTKCDGCGDTLSSNSSYSNKRGTMSLHLQDGQDENGYDKNNRYDYCGEACMLAHLTARAKTKKTTASTSSMKFSNGSLVLDISSDARFISDKERKSAS